MPGECRYGRWPQNEKPKTIKEQIAEREKDASKTPLDLYRDDAVNNRRLREAKLSTLPELPLNEEHGQILKHSLYRILELSVRHQGTNKNAYVYWLEDPIILQWMKIIFAPVMRVSGLCTHVQPWTKPLPTPTLRIESGYLRLMLRGQMWSWKMFPVEDLREMSNHQWHEPTDIDMDWLVTLFGTDPQEEAPPAAPSSSSTQVKKYQSSPTTPSTKRSPGTPLSKALTGAPKTPTPEEPDPILEILEEPLKPSYAGNEDQKTDYEPSIADSDALQNQAVDGEEHQHQTDEEEAVEAIDQSAKEEIIKPTYDFRRVYRKLPALASSDEQAAKRLLLGLHERFWHCPISDFRNILSRCGMPPEVLRLAPEAVSSCTVCRKFVRATRRPQVKTSLACDFNECIQVDIFYFQGDMFLIIVDEATRFKSGGMLRSRELSSILSCLINNWLRFFGPPRELVADQESSIMTQDAGAEMDRLHITRKPKGTTTGREGKKHTGTGLVEKHIDLTKNSMLKIKEEAARYNIIVEKEELLSESLMAQNSTLNFGGYTPAMCVFGVLPRGFMNVDAVNIAVEGADPTTSTFERAARLRQIALAASQRSIIEDRMLRAGRTRPQHIDTTAMIPGTTEVEIFREDPANAGHGWRGPAQLLDLDENNGTVIVKYQGRPYLMSIRHIRPFRGHFFNQDDHAVQEQALHRLQHLVDHCTPYRMHARGQIYIKDTNTGAESWKNFPADLNMQEDQVMRDANMVAKYFNMNLFHGVRYGRALKSIYVPKYTKGILICWPTGTKDCVMTEHLTDQHISIKKEMLRVLDDISSMYLYCYVFFEETTVSNRHQDSHQAMQVHQLPCLFQT